MWKLSCAAVVLRFSYTHLSHHAQQSQLPNVEQRSSARSTHAVLKVLRETDIDGVERKIRLVPSQTVPEQLSSSGPRHERTARTKPEERTGQQAGN